VPPSSWVRIVSRGVKGLKVKRHRHRGGLDAPAMQRTCPCPPVLARLVAQKLTELELLPGIAAARIASETARLKSRGSDPTGDRRKLPAQWRAEFDRCTTNGQRLKVIVRLDRAIAQERGGTRLDQRHGTVQWKIAVATDERASALVAVDYGISASRVRQLRMELVAGTLC
jgi:hypothetical protein